MTKPIWLPELLTLSPWTENTYEALYAIFKKDLLTKKLFYQGEQPVSFDKTLDDNKEVAFWHITTKKDNTNGQRLPDLKRCERLPWLKPLIENSSSPEVLEWEHADGDGTLKVYIWLKDYDYISIMKKTRKGHLILLTAYYVEYANAKRKMMTKFDNRK